MKLQIGWLHAHRINCPLLLLHHHSLCDSRSGAPTSMRWKCLHKICALKDWDVSSSQGLCNQGITTPTKIISFNFHFLGSKVRTLRLRRASFHSAVLSLNPAIRLLMIWNLLESSLKSLPHPSPDNKKSKFWLPLGARFSVLQMFMWLFFQC